MLGKKLENIRASLRAMRWAWDEEFSFRFQICGAAFGLIFAGFVGVRGADMLILAGLFCAVLATELLNTALEELCDAVHPAQDPRIGRVKDLGSAAASVIGIAALFAFGYLTLPKTASFF